MSSIGVAVLGYHWSKELSTEDMTSSYELFSPPLYLWKMTACFSFLVHLKKNIFLDEAF